MPAAAAPEGGTLADWIAYGSARLSASRLAFGHGTHNARDEAVWLLAHVLRLPFERVEASLARTLTAAERRRAFDLLDRRTASRKPLAYLLKEAWLRGTKFYVDERVIVPRSFIAELLPGGLRPWLPRPGAVNRIIDMCTGSGCLAVLAAQEYRNSRVIGADISKDALAVARKNVRLHRLASRIRLIHSDLFANVGREPCDLIVSNPPYVNQASMRRLPAEYRHEPGIALAGGRDGLEAVEVILREALRYLRPRGVLVVEIGHNRKALERRYPALPFTWLPTSAGDDMVFLLTREQLVSGSERHTRR